ncbi:uncharacterized protein TRIVIDRAFT_224218 [Trichoderma virens Gv29-8]|uniref:Uncharacterized protein n=1 Tax=Hypocrea virens (strain Gv29-8 / FGSC 10586) TaxID=413071 RepID=G9MZI3_HYPVG|nr:uncharacterized protein TRIVIDRAFT_224218 [Trichoderma virens Gv29-8]EHK20039.1 hypothetical protein TRIVIDRAFT_224218 [Trichoderma virens Gv29-8]UKZ46016.1 hypothetical protein TrVGV298_000213 [Trichoderma virens]
MPSSQANSPPSLTNLPQEIIRQIFESAPDFSVVNALARTARPLYASYVAGCPAIFHAVASRIQPEFPFAKRLVDTQEAANDASPFLSEDKDKRKNGPSRDERLLSNARCAAIASTNFAAECKIHLFTSARGKENPEFRPSERARFKKSFYQLWTLCILANTPSLLSSALEYLDMLNPIELAGLDEMTNWAMGYSENEPEDSWLDFKTGLRDAGFDMVNQYCDWERKEKSGHRKIHVYSDEAPLGFWVFFDHSQKYLKQIEAHW